LQIVGLNRDEVRRKLAEKNIPSMVYYPIELHKQKAFAIYNEIGEQFPVSEKLCATVLSLPIHTEMTKEMVEFICSNFISIIEQ
jgi:dTDP-4-amino-4,6-dideoxygalactose transaminase